MRRIRLLHPAAVLALLGIAACATSPAGAPSVSPGAPFRDRGVRSVTLAAELARHGRTNAAPLAFLAAAQLLIDAAPAMLADAPVSSGPALAADKPGRVALDVASLLAAAEALGRDNAHVVALAAQLRQRNLAGSRGQIGGTRFRQENVPAGLTHRYRLQYAGGQPAQLGVIGDGDTDLDCFVYDSADTLVAQDVADADVCEITWTPRADATFRIEVRNRSPTLSNVYVMGTN